MISTPAATPVSQTSVASWAVAALPPPLRAGAVFADCWLPHSHNDTDEAAGYTDKAAASAS